jgi:hypothetical protein
MSIELNFMRSANDPATMAALLKHVRSQPSTNAQAM